MKHLKTFESFELINESWTWEDTKNVAQVIINPVAWLGLLMINVLPGKTVRDAIIRTHLDIYCNVDILIAILRKSLDSGNAYDSERKKMTNKIDYLEKMWKKYPTLDDYKKSLARYLVLFTFRNKEYYKDAINKYEARRMSQNELLKEIKRLYKEVSYNDIPEEFRQPRQRWGDMFANVNPDVLDIIPDVPEEDIFTL